MGNDRTDGTLEFLSGLPVTGRQLALGRLFAFAEGCLLAGFAAGIAVGIPLIDRVGPFQLVVTLLTVSSAATLALLSVGACLFWLTLRFSPQTLVSGLLIGVFATSFGGARFLPPLATMWNTMILLLDNHIPVLLGAQIPLVAATLLFGGLLARGFDRYVRNPSLARATSRTR